MDYSGPWWETKMSDDDILGKALMRDYHRQSKIPRSPPPLEEFSDAMMITEMLRRGYAVAKIPLEDLTEELGK